MRLWCHLWGCMQAADAPCCHRCGEYLHGPDYLDSGPLARWVWRCKCFMRERTWTRCQGCNRLLLPWRDYGNGFCSDECFARWLPF